MRARHVAASAVALGVVLVPGVAMAAGGGYGPNTAPTGPADSPGGYSTMLATKSVDSAGGTLPVAVPGGSATITAPAGAFASPVQIEATKPDLTAVSNGLSGAGFSGHKAVAGIGVKVLDGSGTPITGKFAKPITITITGTGLGKAGEKAIMFNGAAAASVLPTTLGTNSITITIDQDPNIAVIDSTSAAAPAVAGATSTHTGIPVAGEYALAGLVALGGLGFLTVARRRTAHR
jgi:hypothetical protein